MKRTPIKRKTKLRKIGGRRAWWLKKDFAWAKEVKKRDKKCQWAGDTPCGGNLEAHHVWPRGTYPSMRFIPENGLALCTLHHAIWHQASTLNRMWWEKRFPERAKIVEKVLALRRAMREHESDELSEPVRRRRRA